MKHVLVILFFILITRLSAQSWQTIGEMPDPVYGAQAVTMDSIIYIFGGHGDSLRDPVNLIQSYDPRTGLWRIVDTMRVPRYGFVADKINDTLAIYCGGVRSNNREMYSSIETWNRHANGIASSQIINYDDNFNRTFLSGHYYNGYFFLFGGIMGGSITDTSRVPFIVRYDVENNSITFPAEDFTAAEISYHHMSVRVDSLVYILGGSRNGLLNSVRSFNLNSFEMKPVMRMQEVRAGGAAVYHDNTIHVIGGYSESNDAIGGTVILDLDSLNSRPGPGLNYSRKEMVAVNYFDQAIYVFGGRNEQDNLVPMIEKLDLVVSVEPIAHMMPNGFVLGDNFPDPFNASTVIEFALDEPGQVRLDIYSINGQLIKTLFSGHKNAGSHRYTWHGENFNDHAVASGIYIYRLVSKSGVLAKKMALIR